MLAFVVLGGPNFGKGTVSRSLKQEGFLHINSGDYMRKRLKNDVLFRNEYREQMKNGYFLPDNVANSCFDQMFRQSGFCPGQNVTIDGLFRTGPQCEYGILKLQRLELLPVFIELEDVRFADAWARAQKRAEEECRPDDLDPDVFTRRFGLYYAHLADVRQKIKTSDELKSRYHFVRANLSPEHVAAEIVSIRRRYRPVEQGLRDRKYCVIQPEVGCGS